MNQLVRHHRVHALGRYLVVSQLHILILIQTDGLETAVVFQDPVSLGFLSVHIDVVVSLKFVLTGFQHRVGFVSVLVEKKS